ncbi:uroporphyrinogen III decarboxylase [Spirochaetia bacterium]|nr:uroporphyrinogen III decarboxylase [Spirochaetia bacterium]
MTHKERASIALNGGIPDQVPTFELEYQLAAEVFGKPFLRQKDLIGLSPKEKDRAIKENAEYMIKVFGALDYSIIPIHYLDEPEKIETAKHIHAVAGDEYMITTHGDGTFYIPDGNTMLDFSYRLFDDPAGVCEEAEHQAVQAIEQNKRLMDGGFDSFILCSDYCFNNGPFLSPDQFRQFVQPYLARIIESIRQGGAFAIKHTDGNIMPILDQLVECHPHALHSIDPMAGVDIKVVKELVGDKVCLCGNVHCAALQTGTLEDVRKSAEYCLTWAKPGGGYIFCTSNIPFHGMPVERYSFILDIWKRMRDY